MGRIISLFDIIEAQLQIEHDRRLVAELKAKDMRLLESIGDVEYRRRTSNRALKYGLSVATLLKIIERAEYKCEICRTQLHTGVRGSAIDHDHVTGRVRGILCPNCNSMLGFAMDNPDTLVKASEYLKRVYNPYG